MSWRIGQLLLLFAAGALTSACSGGKMLEQRTPAPPLSAREDGSIVTIDGRTLSLEQLHRRGPVMLVFLRGFS